MDGQTGGRQKNPLQFLRAETKNVHLKIRKLHQVFLHKKETLTRGYQGEILRFLYTMKTNQIRGDQICTEILLHRKETRDAEIRKKH